jgi:hypothetical protein
MKPFLGNLFQFLSRTVIPRTFFRSPIDLDAYLHVLAWIERVKQLFGFVAIKGI